MHMLNVKKIHSASFIIKDIILLRSINMTFIVDYDNYNVRMNFFSEFQLDEDIGKNDLLIVNCFRKKKNTYNTSEEIMNVVISDFWSSGK